MTNADRETPPPSRWAGLDGLRGIAVLLVVAGHAYVPLFPDGAIGVHVFFVLSGFLITRLLLDEFDGTGRIWFTGFYARRALRLFPALALLLVGYVIMAHFFPSWGANTVRNTAAVALYFANIARILDWNLGLLGHTWSLAVEEHFYVLWPVLALLLARSLSARSFAVFATVAAVALFGWRLALPFEEYRRIYLGTDTNAAALMAGAALAGWRRARGLPTVPRQVVWLGLILLLAAAIIPLEWMDGYAGVHGRYAFVILVSLLLTAAATRAVPVLENRVLRWFGTISYSLYLWHYALIGLLLYAWPVQPPWVRGVPMAALSILFAAASYYLFEVRFLRFKPHRKAPGPDAAEPRVLEVPPVESAGPLPTEGTT